MLQLGVCKVDITPKIGCQMIGYMPDVLSEEVHDNLDATAFVFQSGENKAVLICSAVCAIDKKLGDVVRERIEKETGIPVENIMVSAIHTHSGPATAIDVDWDYCDNIYIPQVMEAIKQASANMQAVKVGYACGESLVGINRRERKRNNKVDLGQNPWGPFDPRMTVITFKNEEGKIVASLIHYSAHATAAGLNHIISQDWPGVMVRRVEALAGAPAAFINGCIGDVGPRLTCGKTLADIHYAEELGGVAAQDATRIFKSITQHTDADMKAVTAQVELPVKTRMPLDEAQEMLAQCVKSKYDSEILIRNHYADVVKSYENPDFEEEKFRTTTQTILRIGNIVLLGFSYEIFSEISLRIQKESKELIVLPVTNVNGCEGYFPTQSEIPMGGYEVQMFQTKNLQEFVDDADYHLICGSLENIKKVL